MAQLRIVLMEVNIIVILNLCLSGNRDTQERGQRHNKLKTNNICYNDSNAVLPIAGSYML